MKKTQGMKLIIAIACIILTCSTIAGIYAVLMGKTDAVTNTFALGAITCDINETFDGIVKSNVSIRNTSEVEAFIRADINVTWMSNDGTSVYSDTPVLGIDYNMVLNQDDWFEGADGHYYHKGIVKSGELSDVLIRTAEMLNGATQPNGFHLSIEVISSSIQANPRKAIKDAWYVVEWTGAELSSTVQ